MSALFWGITRRRVVFTDVSGQRIGSIFKGQDPIIMLGDIRTL
jgi:hypothetical protein